MGARLDGSANYINCGAVIQSNPLTALSGSCWVYLNTVTSDDGLWSIGSAFNSSKCMAYIYQSKLWIDFANGGGSGSVAITTGLHFIAWSWDGSTMTIWLDGVKSTYGHSPSPNLSGCSLFLGVYYGQGIDADISDFRMYSTTLTDSNAAALLAGQSNDTLDANCIGRWLIADKAPGEAVSGAGSVIDISGNGKHGTPSGTFNYAVVAYEYVALIPKNTAATQGTQSGKVVVTWDKVDWGTQEFQVQRSATSGGSYSDISGWISAETYDDTTVSGTTHYFYKVKAKIVTHETALGSYAEGWAAGAGPVTYPLVYDAPKSVITPRILILDSLVDIYARVVSLPDISVQKSFMRSNITQNQITINCQNYDDFFSVGNPLSAFSSVEWRYKPLRIYDYSGNLVWDGYIRDISRNHFDKTATIISCDLLSLHMMERCVYSSSTWETPSEAAKNIMDLYGVPYDSRTLNASTRIYGSATIKCAFTFATNTSVQSALESLASVGSADCYAWNNRIYFSHRIMAPTVADIQISIDQMYDLPTITTDDQILCNDYAVGYVGDGGTPVTDAAGNNIGNVSRARYGTQSSENISGRSGDIIEISGKAAAEYFGEARIRRSHVRLSTNPAPLEHIGFSVPMDFQNYIDPQKFLGLTFADEAWAGKLFEVYGITLSFESNTMTLDCYEV